MDTGNWARTGRDRSRPVRKSVVWTRPRIRNERSSCPRVDTGNWARTGRDRSRPVRKSVVWTRPYRLKVQHRSVVSIKGERPLNDNELAIRFTRYTSLIVRNSRCSLSRFGVVRLDFPCRYHPAAMAFLSIQNAHWIFAKRKLSELTTNETVRVSLVWF